MAIVGKMDAKKLAEVLVKKDAEKRRAKRRAAKRPESLTEKAEQILAEGKRSIGSLAEQVNEVATELMAQRKEATQQGLTRRLENGRWISRASQAEAIEMADALEKLGF